MSFFGPPDPPPAPAPPAAPVEPRFVPEYIVPMARSDFGGKDVTWANSDWFLTLKSTQYLAKKFHAVFIDQYNFFGFGPNYFVDANGVRTSIPQYVLIFAALNGGSVTLPAGYLASYYARHGDDVELRIWENLRNSGVFVPLSNLQNPNQ